MSIIYSTEDISSNHKGKFSYPGWMEDRDFANIYLKHLDNLMYLKFIYMNSDRSVEKMQAKKEMEIAENKMEWWAKQPKFQSQKNYVEQKSNEIKLKWQSK